MSPGEITCNYFFHTVPHGAPEFSELIVKCSNLTGGMNVTLVEMEVSDEPIILNRHIIQFGLREPIRQVMQSMDKMDSSNWATPTVTLLRAEGKVPLNKLFYQSCASKGKAYFSDSLVHRYFQKLI